MSLNYISTEIISINLRFSLAVVNRDARERQDRNHLRLRLLYPRFVKLRLAESLSSYLLSPLNVIELVLDPGCSVPRTTLRVF